MRYWDFSLPSAEVHPTTVSKYNTFLQLILVGATATQPVVPPVVLGLDVGGAITAMQYLVAATTLWSGASYTWRKDAVKILGEDEALKSKQGFRGRLVIGTSFAAFVGLATWCALSGKRDSKEENQQPQQPR